MAFWAAALPFIGSLIGGSSSRQDAKQAMAGFNYLADNQVGQQYVPQGAAANTAISDLLGVGGDPTRAKAAFDNYLGSTGYNFQLGQGQNAIASSNAAKGLLNSGATAKALTRYGQDLAATTFNNYLTQLGGLSTRGLQGAGMIGQAGTVGGIGQARIMADPKSGSNASSIFSDMFGGFGNMLGL